VRRFLGECDRVAFLANETYYTGVLFRGFRWVEILNAMSQFATRQALKLIA